MRGKKRRMTLKQFLKLLKSEFDRAGLPFVIGIDGTIRSRANIEHDDRNDCPIAFLTGVYNTSYDEGAKQLGLSRKLGEDIAAAADFKLSQLPTLKQKMIRVALLAALDLA